MNNTVNTTTTGTAYTVSSNCSSKLPCGYCILLNRPCPMQFEVVKTSTWDPTWYKTNCQQEGTNG